MGQAKRRGTYEQRKALAVQKVEIAWQERMARLKAEDDEAERYKYGKGILLAQILGVAMGAAR